MLPFETAPFFYVYPVFPLYFEVNLCVSK